MKFLFSIGSVFLCLMALGMHIFHLTLIWEDIPNNILIMYSGDSPNQLGPKELLFIIPIISIILWIIIYYLRSIRRKFNYINKTKENREVQYASMYIMLTLIQTLSFLGCICLNESFLRDAVGIDSNFFENTAIILFVLCAIPPILMAIWSRTMIETGNK